MWSKSDGLALLRRESVQIVLLVVFAMAVYLPSHRSHWRRAAEGDERGQIEVSGQSLHHVVTTYQSGQNHPLYGILAHFSMRALPVAGPYAARLPALLAGLLIPLAFYYAHRRWVGPGAALLVAYILVASDPLHYYASAARGYTLMVLFVLLANSLFLIYLRDGRPVVLFLYVLSTVAAAYSHLWGALVLPAHGAFLIIDHSWHRFVMGRQGEGETRREGAGLPQFGHLAISPVPCPLVRRSGLFAGSAIALAVLLITALYLPMLPEIRAMAGHRGEAPLGLVDKVLGLVTFRSWTTAAYVLLVPIALEGLARRVKGGRLERSALGAGFSTPRTAPAAGRPNAETSGQAGGSVGRPTTTQGCGDRTIWLHITMIVCVLAVTEIVQPANFYRRFLMVILPSISGLAAWCFAGALRGPRPLTLDPGPLTNSLLKNGDRHHATTQNVGRIADRSERVPVFQQAANLLPLPATWLAGFALGVLVSNTSMSSFMSWQYGANTTPAGRDQGYYYRNLPKAVEALGDRMMSLLKKGGRHLARKPNLEENATGSERIPFFQGPATPGFPVAGALLAIAAVVIGWRLRRSAAASIPNRRSAYFAVCVWTGLLLAGVVPLILGPAFTLSQPWLFELHTIAAATVCLLAWRYREDVRLLRALRYGVLLSALVLVYWQFGVEHPRLDASAMLRIASLVPAAAFAASVLLPGGNGMPRPDSQEREPYSHA